MQKQQDHLNFADDIVLDKTTIKKINCTSSRPIKINDRHLEEISSFVYLGSTVSVNGGTDENIKEKINKARVVFNLLKTKLRIFNSNVKSVLLYGSETWRNTKSSNNNLQTFVNICLRRTLKISRTADRLTNKKSLEASKSRSYSNTNQAKKMEMDWSHVKETSRQCFKASSEMESPSRVSEKEDAQRTEMVTHGTPQRD